MGPIDYLSAVPQQDFLKDIQGGFQLGTGIRQVQQQYQQQQLAQQRAQQYQAATQAAMTNPNPQAFAKLALDFPEHAAPLKQAWEQMDAGDRKQEGDTMAQAYSALLSGRHDIAQQTIQDVIDARKNSGLDTSHYDNALRMVKDDPTKASASLGFILSHINDPKAFATQFGALGGEQRTDQQGPADLAKKNADAIKAAAEAQVAVGTVPALIQKPVEENLTAQTKRRVDEFNVQIAAANSETERGRLTLERDKFVADQSLKSTESGATAQSQIDSAQHALDTIKTLRADPAAKDSVGNWFSGPGTVLGKMLSHVPGTENMDYKAQLESLKSQVFLPAVQQVKGMGSLSNAEGEKLGAAVAGLNADMSPKARDNAIGIIEKYMTKGLQKGLASKGVPVQGGGFVVAHPVYGAVKEGDINRLMKQYPGATREQVMAFLASGKK
jgi:hypothetical protein